MSTQTGWFVAGLVLLVIAGMAIPRIAGTVVVLVVIVLAIKLAQKQLI